MKHSLIELQRPEVGMTSAKQSRPYVALIGGRSAFRDDPHSDIGASIASGSHPVAGMIVAPCSIRTLSAIANCATGDLVSRAADVVLKERRRLVLLVRETPLHAGHLRLMLQATENGAIVMPPVPAFYAEPASIEELVDHTVGRALDLLGIDTELVNRWAGMGDWAARQASDPGER